MPTFEIIRGATTYNVSHDQPIRLVSVDDMGGASVRNQRETGPYQHGASHISERLEPTVLTLKFNVLGSTAADLDARRDTFNAMFKPVEDIPITIRVTRDDGEVRQIDTFREGRLGIRIEPEDFPGHIHRGVAQVIADDPTWYNPEIEEGSFNIPSDWWLAYNTIGTASVLEHAENPGTAQLWTNTGTVASGSAWSVAFRSGSVSPASLRYAWATNGFMYFGAGPGFTGGYEARANNAGNVLIVNGALMSAGTSNYMSVYDGGTLSVYRDGALLGQDTGDPPLAILAGTARWRSSFTGAGNTWTAALPYAAAYNIALSPTQRSALDQVMNNVGSAFSTTFVYDGDWDTYPVLVITGPMGNPVITNTATGDTLDFTGGTVGSADAWTIDTRYGLKSVLNTAGSSVEQYLSADSDLATFRIVPDPIATGGTNVITVQGTATSGSTSITISYYNRYMDY
jgi:hypothetical protein